MFYLFALFLSLTGEKFHFSTREDNRITLPEAIMLRAKKAKRSPVPHGMVGATVELPTQGVPRLRVLPPYYRLRPVDSRQIAEVKATAAATGLAVGLIATIILAFVSLMDAGVTAASTAAISTRLVESNQATPADFYVDDEVVAITQDTFVLEIDQDLREDDTYTLAVPADGYGEIDLDDPNTYEVKEVPVDGQKARLNGLFQAIEERKWGEARRKAESLTRFRASQMEVDIWAYTEDTEGTADVFRDRGRGHELSRVEQLEAMRRFCWASDTSFATKLVKLADGSEDEIRDQIQTALDENGEVGAEDVDSFAVRHSNGLSEAMKELLAHYESRGLVLAGGSPDSGLMLFVEPSALQNVPSANKSQKAGKIFMRGGRRMAGGDLDQLVARLVDFESGKYGKRDGIFMAISNKIAGRLARSSGIPAGWSYQGQFIDVGRALMKGMIYVVGEDCPSADLQQLLEDQPENVVIDYNVWQKVVETDHDPGDVVKIDPQKLWAMESDARSTIGEVSISPQLIERAGSKLTRWLSDEMSSAFDDFIEATKTGEDIGDYVSPFGRLGKMAAIGLNFFESNRADVADELSDSMAHFARKGAKTAGTPVRLFYDDDLSEDMTDNGERIPGARVPESWGLDVGDEFLFVAYPALPALDGEGRNTCIFTVQVEEVCAAPHIYLHGDTALRAMRDEDGDMPIAIVPDEDSPELPSVGQADIDLDVIQEDANSPKRHIFEAPIGEETDPLPKEKEKARNGHHLAASKNVFEVYSRLGARVGRVDNMATAAMLYIDDLDEVETPTGEHSTIFLAKCIQAMIDSKKHIVEPEYSLDELRSWTKEVTTAWSREDGFQKHPAMKVRDPLGHTNDTRIDDHVEALADLVNADAPNGVWGNLVKRLFSEVSLAKKDGERVVFPPEEAFVEETFYEDAAWEIRHALLSLFVEEDIFDAAGKLGEQVWQDANAAGRRERGDLEPSSKEGRLSYYRGQMRHLKIAKLRLRNRLSAAEFAVVQMYFAMKSAEEAEGHKNLKAALAVCSQNFLQTVAKVGHGEISGEEEILDELGMDGRNLIRSEDKSEEFTRALRDVRKTSGITIQVEENHGLEKGDPVVAGPVPVTKKLVWDGEETHIDEQHHGILEYGQHHVRNVGEDGRISLVYRG